MSFSFFLCVDRYVIVYFSILYFRYHAGLITDEMLSLPKTPFLAVGLLEALAAASGMAAGGNQYVILLFLVFLAPLVNISCSTRIQFQSGPTNV